MILNLSIGVGNLSYGIDILRIIDNLRLGFGILSLRVDTVILKLGILRLKKAFKTLL